MAGSFGFEREHYDVSVAVDERVLLPAVRGAAEDTLLIADGFSIPTSTQPGWERRSSAPRPAPPPRRGPAGYGLARGRR